MNEAEVKQSAPTTYQNNPFLVALDGVKALFTLAKSVAIFFIVLSALNLIRFTDQGGYGEETTSEENMEIINKLESISADTWMLIGMIAFVVAIGLFVLGCIVNSISDYTASKIAKGEKTTLKLAFSATLKRLGSYILMRIIVSVKTLLWTLLFIIPGIIMANRYSLSGVAFFAENLKPSDAVKRSLTLTKGAWITTFGSQTLFNLVTFGLVSPLVMPGVLGVLYRQFAATPDTKPKAHFLSWLTLIIPSLVVFVMIALAYAALNFATTAP